MNDVAENKFWLILWTLVLISILAIVAGVTTYNLTEIKTKKETIELMIKNNYSPEIVQKYIDKK